ncbi:MAG: HlyC/CorC family transporter [Bacteroidetes bacterium]|nr:MAG: HlyC/CorC family transporter [Bacteroidota bacterium]
MGYLIAFFILSIAFSFLCSVLEAVLLSITPRFISQEVNKGGAVGEALQEYKKDIDRPLSAILTLNTIAHTVGAIGVGAQAGKLFGSNYLNLFGLKLSVEGLIAVFMTLAILIVSEIIPKTIGANNWRALTPFTVNTLKVIMFILAPLVWVSQLITRNLKSEKEKSVFSRRDFAALAHEGKEGGSLAHSEYRIITNLLGLDKLTVRDIMTPRTVMTIADANETLEEFFKNHNPLPFSRIPVYEDMDEFSGMILKDDLLLEMVDGNNKKKLKDIAKPLLYVKDSAPLPQFFEELSSNSAHMALVVDEFGSTVGLVTMEDLLETIIGVEITDESDAVEDLRKFARERWEERAKRLGVLE